MGCNGKGHSSDCDCGWGGDASRFGTKKESEESIPAIYLSSWKSKASDAFAIPNKKCPVCGAYTFFVHPKQGGYVYFDDFGPPWAKHPCMDIGTPGLGRADTHDALKVASFSDLPKWYLSGWRLFLFESLIEVDRYCYKLEGQFESKRFAIFFKLSGIIPGFELKVLKSDILHLRVSASGASELSRMAIDLNTEILPVYRSISDSRKGESWGLSMRNRKIFRKPHA